MCSFLFKVKCIIWMWYLKVIVYRKMISMLEVFLKKILVGLKLVNLDN